ncbi:MAG: TIR domain-containing protein [Alphaproteobacteria bacterium]|nr:TIR domain-containing protein [Alphaproteobacteria bacterium]
MADVFVSYKSEDRTAVEDLVTGLKAEGFSVWWDQGIAPTTEWRAEIHRQLQSAKVVVVIWSRASVDFTGGRWVIQEAEDADRRGALAPALIDDVLPPLGLRHVQAADLIDWRGDRQDPRWRGFLETVRAKIEGRPVDARIARDTGPRTLGAMMRGRVALLTLTLGLAALVVASALAFGPFVAAVLVGGVVLAYLVLNVLFARRRGERAAASFLRRAFAVGWVTIAANVVVWIAAIGAFAYPYARAQLYDDFSVAVVDELRRPVADAQVTAVFGDRRTRIVLNSDGVGVVEYPRYWGADAGALDIQHRDHAVSVPIERSDGARFTDIVLGVPSGEERFRVTHVTLSDLAIDLVLNGRTPYEVAAAFPNIVGVIRNPVTETAEAFLEFSYAVSGIGVYAGAIEMDGDETRQIPQEARARYAGLRSAVEFRYDMPGDFGAGIENCPADRALDGAYRLALRPADDFNAGDLLTGRSPALARINAPQDEDGRYSGEIVRLIDHEWLERNRGAILRDLQRYDDDGAIRRENNTRLDFYIDHRMPLGASYARYSIAARPGCGGAWPTEIAFSLPAPTLRVSIIENVGDAPMPIGDIVQRLTEREGERFWSPEDRGDDELKAPWPGGVLAPGAAIVVPRRLMFENVLSLEERASYLARAAGATTSFTVLTADQRFPDAQPRDMEQVVPRHQARRFTIHDSQIALYQTALDEMKGSGVYAVGPSVDSLAVEVNGVAFPLREDEGRNLAMLTGSLMVGSCPFVFSSHAGSDVMLNRGQIITDQIGADAEAPDRVYLGRTVNAVEIREREPEISRLNSARLVVRKADGGETVHRPVRPALQGRDDDYPVLAQGEHARLRFPTYAPADDDVGVYLEVVGYYTTVPALLRDFPAAR